MAERPRSQKDYFVATKGDFVITPSRWTLKYEQPDGRYLVTNAGEFATYCAQSRPGEDPDAVLRELVDNGAVRDAPESLIQELIHLGVLKRDAGTYQVVR